MSRGALDLFEKEKRVLDEADALLANGVFAEQEERAAFTALRDSYAKLLKSSVRLVRLSDRNEEQLNALAKSLDEKNATLETLSEKLGKYLPKQLYASIFEGKQDVALITKRKKLTIFFSDLKDFTTITDDPQPEDLADLLALYFREMSQIALRHGGTIDKFIGDAMLIFFGDPISNGIKEDATACVSMAIEMQRRMDELQHAWTEFGVESAFQMRVGINSGYCNVGNFGSEERMDYTVIGGEVNLAARLEAACEPGGVLISSETRSLIGDQFRVEPRGSLTCKGIRRRVPAYAVVDQARDDGREVALVHDGPGLSLRLDASQLSEAARGEAENVLEQALAQLRSSPSDAAVVGDPPARTTVPTRATG